MKLYYLIIFELFIIFNCQAQKSTDSLEVLLVKKWTVQNMIKPEENTPIINVSSSKIIIEFEQNHSYKANFSGQDESGIWNIDIKNRIVELKDEKSKEFLKLEIVELSSSKCILRMNKKDGNIELILTSNSSKILSLKQHKKEVKRNRKN